MPALQHVGKHDGVAAVLAALAADGAVIVRDFLEPATLQHFRDDMEAHASGHRVGTSADSQMVQRFWGANTKRFTRLAHRSASFVEILTDPLYLAVADAVLLPDIILKTLDDHDPLDDLSRRPGELRGLNDDDPWN